VLDHRSHLGTVLRTVLVIVGVALCLYLIYLLRKPLLWVLLALFLAVALSAPVNFLNRYVRRGLAIAAVYLLLLAVPTAIAALVVPPIVTQMTNLVNDLPHYANDLQDFANRNPTLRKLETDYHVTERLQEQAQRLPPRLSDAAGLLQDAGLTLVNSLFALITILVLAAFMLGSGRLWVDRVIALQPEDRAVRLRRVADRSAAAVGSYVGGALVQATIAGVLAYIMLTILGVQFRAPLAVLIFLLDLVPLIGATIGAVVVAVVTLFTDFPTATIAWVVFSIVYQQVENNVIQPRIQQRAVDVHPLGVLISVLFGASLLGILGALVAIPIAATLQIAMREWWAWRADQRLEAEPGEATRLADREQISTGDDPEAEPPPPLPRGDGTSPAGGPTGEVPPA
jgi:predicted PurR-regulated permease PerM